jgi:hypothetical protein
MCVIPVTNLWINFMFHISLVTFLFIFLNVFTLIYIYFIYIYICMSGESLDSSCN